MQYPQKAAEVLSIVAEKIKIDMEAGRLKIDLIVGPAMGGIIVAYELGRQLAIPAIFTERDENGIMVLRRGFEIQKGQNILIAEDVVTTAKSSGETAKALVDKGGIISGLASIVDRRSPGIEVDWPFYSAIKIPVDNLEADKCELCKNGIPLIKPGSRKIF